MSRQNKRENIGLTTLDDAFFHGYLPKRKSDTAKWDYGSAAIIGGSVKYGGAPLLAYSALSAYRMGAGYSALFVPKELYDIYVGRFPQLLLSSLPSKDGCLAFEEKAYEAIAKRYSVIAIGMGISDCPDFGRILGYLLKQFDGTLVIDADGLNAISRLGADVLDGHRPGIVLTPHVGEFSRLSGLEASYIKENAYACALSFAKKHRVTLVLKGSKTVITDGRESYLNEAGNPGLAKAGSGDLLSGLIAGALTQRQVGGSVTKKAAFASYVLGRCAERAAKAQSEYSLLYEDILREVGPVLLSFEE
jgi:NAD(P)H-hydrate epimerase